MANVLYPSAKQSMLSANLDMPSEDIKAALIDTNDVTYSAAHTVYSDISAGVVGTPVILTGKSFTGGVFDSDDPTWTGVSGDQFEAIVLYLDTGVAGTSPLIAWYDTSITGLPMTPVSGNITFLVDASGWFGL